jgi:hypothetical protein
MGESVYNAFLYSNLEKKNQEETISVLNENFWIRFIGLNDVLLLGTSCPFVVNFDQREALIYLILPPDF